MQQFKNLFVCLYFVLFFVSKGVFYIHSCQKSYISNIISIQVCLKNNFKIKNLFLLFFQEFVDELNGKESEMANAFKIADGFRDEAQVSGFVLYPCSTKNANGGSSVVSSTQSCPLSKTYVQMPCCKIFSVFGEKCLHYTKGFMHLSLGDRGIKIYSCVQSFFNVFQPCMCCID